MKDRKKYTLDDVQKLAAKLREMPKAEATEREVSKAEAVKMMVKEIKAMQAKNYTMKMIAEVLSQNKFAISESVLKSYMQRAGGSAEATKRKQVTSKAEPAASSGNKAVKANEQKAAFKVKPDSGKDEL